MKKLLSIALVLMMVFSLAAATAAADGGDHVLRVGTLQAANTFDPLASELDITMNLVYDTVLKRDPDTLEVSPNVASSWTWEDDTTLRLTIRDDIFFSNGEKLTPEEIMKVNLPTGVPLVYEFDDQFNVLSKGYLGDPDAIAAKINKVADQGKAKG